MKKFLALAFAGSLISLWITWDIYNDIRIYEEGCIEFWLGSVTECLAVYGDDGRFESARNLLLSVGAVIAIPAFAWWWYAAPEATTVKAYSGNTETDSF